MFDPASLGVGAVGAMAAAVGVWLVQRNRHADRRAAAQVTSAAAEASVQVAVVNQVQAIFAEHERMRADLVRELTAVRAGAVRCERLVAAMRSQLVAAGLDPVEETT